MKVTFAQLVWTKLKFCLLPLLCAGCMGVPKTEINFNPVTHTLTVRSPKDIAMTNLVAEVTTNGEARITIGSYSSRNNAEVIAAVAAQNAEVMKSIADISGKVIAEAASKIK